VFATVENHTEIACRWCRDRTAALNKAMEWENPMTTWPMGCGLRLEATAHDELSIRPHHVIPRCPLAGSHQRSAVAAAPGAHPSTVPMTANAATPALSKQ